MPTVERGVPGHLGEGAQGDHGRSPLPDGLLHRREQGRPDALPLRVRMHAELLEMKPSVEVENVGEADGWSVQFGDQHEAWQGECSHPAGIGGQVDKPLEQGVCCSLDGRDGGPVTRRADADRDAGQVDSRAIRSWWRTTSDTMKVRNFSANSGSS